MNKATLRLLGQFDELHSVLWNDLCRVLPVHGEGSPQANDRAAKLRLLDKLWTEIEEQARGFKKTRLKYAPAGAFFIRNHFLPYAELHRGVTTVLLNTKTDTTAVILSPPSL